jgi:transposase
MPEEGHPMPAQHPSRCEGSRRAPVIGQGDEQYHLEVNQFIATLNREQRRLYAALEATRLGRSGVRTIAQVTGMCDETIRRGQRQMADLLAGKAPKRRPACGGRPRVEQKYPQITAALEKLLAGEVAGDPMSNQKWVRSSVKKLQKQLREKGFRISHSTIWCLLKRLGYSMRTNVRKRRGPCKDPARRDEQFQYIAKQRKAFQDACLPIISVDSKKKELIGDFRNPGKCWSKAAEEVDEHDSPGMAECRAVPYGVYDVTKNEGYVVVGVSNNTPEFAANVIARWWEEAGRVTYPTASEVLILADGGGANGCRARAWKLLPGAVNSSHLLGYPLVSFAYRTSG